MARWITVIAALAAANSAYGALAPRELIDKRWDNGGDAAPLWGGGGPVLADVKQTSTPDCWLVASIAAVVHFSPEGAWIKSLFDGVANPTSDVAVAATTIYNGGINGTAYDIDYSADINGTVTADATSHWWPGAIQRGIEKQDKDIKAKGWVPGGSAVGFGLGYISGYPAKFSWSNNNATFIWSVIKRAKDERTPVVLATPTGELKKLVSNHAYAVFDAAEDANGNPDWVEMHNPWGLTSRYNFSDIVDDIGSMAHLKYFNSWNGGAGQNEGDAAAAAQKLSTTNSFDWELPTYRLVKPYVPVHLRTTAIPSPTASQNVTVPTASITPAVNASSSSAVLAPVSPTANSTVNDLQANATISNVPAPSNTSAPIVTPVSNDTDTVIEVPTTNDTTVEVPPATNETATEVPVTNGTAVDPSAPATNGTAVDPSAPATNGTALPSPSTNGTTTDASNLPSTTTAPSTTPAAPTATGPTVDGIILTIWDWRPTPTAGTGGHKQCKRSNTGRRSALTRHRRRVAAAARKAKKAHMVAQAKVIKRADAKYNAPGSKLVGLPDWIQQLAPPGTVVGKIPNDETVAAVGQL